MGRKLGWVPACARTTEGGDGEGRPYGDAGGEREESVRGKGFIGAERAIFMVMTIGGAALCWVRNDMWFEGEGMGPRMRKDNGGG